MKVGTIGHLGFFMVLESESEIMNDPLCNTQPCQ